MSSDPAALREAVSADMHTTKRCDEGKVWDPSSVMCSWPLADGGCTDAESDDCPPWCENRINEQPCCLQHGWDCPSG